MKCGTAIRFKQMVLYALNYGFWNYTSFSCFNDKKNGFKNERWTIWLQKSLSEAPALQLRGSWCPAHVTLFSDVIRKDRLFLLAFVFIMFIIIIIVIMIIFGFIIITIIIYKSSLSHHIGHLWWSRI